MQKIETSKLENIYSYDNYLRPWCLGKTYDYCPLMIIVMIFVIMISVILIIIICIHNRKPYITQLFVSYLVDHKNKFMRLFFCKKQSDSTAYVSTASRHSAIHNSIFWVNNDITRPAPPSYDESRQPPMSSLTSSGYSSYNVNSGFSVEDVQPQVRQYRETPIDTFQLPENNYYDCRRFNRNNLSFMSTDSFQFVQSSAPKSNSILTTMQVVPQSTSSTLISAKFNEQPPAYEAVVENFKKVSDCDNLNKFKRLQQKYQQSVGQTRREFYKQKHPNRKLSSATIISESEIIV
jgi:hypothetical protein